MQIIIELTDEEAAAIEAEIDTFPILPEAKRMTIAAYLKDYANPKIQRLVEANRLHAIRYVFEAAVEEMNAIPADKQAEALAEIQAVLEKHREKEAPSVETGEMDVSVEATPREQKG